MFALVVLLALVLLDLFALSGHVSDSRDTDWSLGRLLKVPTVPRRTVLRPIARRD